MDLSFTDEDTSDVPFTIESADDSVHLPTPPPLIRRTLKAVTIPQKVCFMDLAQLDKFIEQVNHIRSCVTPGCMGELTPVKVSSVGLGGAVSIKYNCNGCAHQEALFEHPPNTSCTIPVILVLQYRWHSLWLDAHTPRTTKH